MLKKMKRRNKKIIYSVHIVKEAKNLCQTTIIRYVFKNYTSRYKHKLQKRQVKVTLSAHKYFVPRKGIIEEQNVKTG